MRSSTRQSSLMAARYVRVPRATSSGWGDGGASTTPAWQARPLATRHGSEQARGMGVRIAIAEDSFLVREALTQLLSDAPEIDLVAVCDDATQLRRVIDTHDLDVVVTDIRMPPTGTDEGIRLAGELRITHPEMAVVVLSAYCEPPYALALLDGGS